jgi:hypothetical protein
VTRILKKLEETVPGGVGMKDKMRLNKDADIWLVILRTSVNYTNVNYS